MQYPQCFGAHYSKEQTEFTLWAPHSEAVELRLYAFGSEEEDPCDIARHPMTKHRDGVFSCTLSGDLNGTYYDFCLTDKKGRQCVSADPWAKACGLNGSRSMVIDLASTNPEGWDYDRHPQTKGIAPVIYEVHVKDFSADPRSGVRPEWQGKYLGFTESGTTLDGAGHVPTCLDHLKKLGVTHVQLQPIADIASIPEENPTAYNWGYDIGNYNVPEGSYATDPRKGDVRIRECKQMIMALHNAGIGVILDVVYNHTYHRHSALDRTAPGEYYRHAKDGSFMNASGCGNETASEKPPFRNYMLQSLLYWVKEYHVDGFRFDLMAIHDVETMNLVRSALDELPNGKSILTYGEPWSALPSAIKAPGKPVTKDAIRLLDPRIGVFSDLTRNVLAGTAFDAHAPGFGPGRMTPERVSELRQCITGLCREDLGEPETLAPSQAVHYACCHDNYTVWDRLIAQAGLLDYDNRNEELVRRMRLISGTCLVCTGLGFIHEGEEFCRTKHGDGNSYQGPISTNRLNWSLAQIHADLTEWYRGLIGLRREMMPSLSRSAADGITFLDARWNDSILFTKNVRTGSRFGCYLVCINASSEAHSLTLPDGIWTVLCDGVRSNLWIDCDQQAADPMFIPAESIVILGR